jgi:hypothetical protein
LFWAKLVKHAIDQQPEIADFAVFVDDYPILLESQAIYRHYSAEVLQSERARASWIEPDLRALPDE